MENAQLMIIVDTIYVVVDGDRVYNYDPVTEGVGAYVGRLHGDDQIIPDPPAPAPNAA
jgi:hypothetical protein